MLSVFATLFAAALVQVLGLPAIAETAEAPAPGKPRAELTADELAAFNAGRGLFVSKLSKVGPLYNGESCASCHFVPTVGGSGDRDHGVYFGPGHADVVEGKPPRGDTEGYPRYALPGWTVPVRPPNVSVRIPPPLYGLGLVEQIPDETIRAACGKGHVDLAKMQGSLPRNHVARFGMKPFLGTVPDFISAALLSEMSVTNALDTTKDEDSFPDPEVDLQFIESLAAFVRGLQPPGRNGTDAAGEAVFHSLGCASCHVPDMPPAKDVFSDFCLHRMGEGLADGIFDHEAEGDEFRTTPLWGLRFKKLYLHDGRATTLDAAITAHGGEAESVVAAYRAASDQDRAALFRFLKTL